jgi:hypothetical protein
MDEGGLCLEELATVDQGDVSALLRIHEQISKYLHRSNNVRANLFMIDQ